MKWWSQLSVDPVLENGVLETIVELLDDPKFEYFGQFAPAEYKGHASVIPIAEPIAENARFLCLWCRLPFGFWLAENGGRM